MIQIEFRPEDLHLRGDQLTGIGTLSGELLENTFFNLPVRFNVDGIELFEKVPLDNTVFVCQVEREMLEPTLNLEMTSPWSPVPLLHLATVGLSQFRKACQGETTAFYHLPGGGHLQLRPNGDSLEIYSSISQRSVSANCAELQKAFERFKERTRQFLMEEVPGLEEHPDWFSWFG